MIDTDRTDVRTPNFSGTGLRLFVGDTLATAQVRRLYIPSTEAKEWDGVAATHALGSRHGGYVYVNVKVTGRKDLYTSQGLVRKVRIEVGLDADALPVGV